MTMFQRIADSTLSRGLALAAAGVIGLASMGGVAEAKGVQRFDAPARLQLVRKDDDRFLLRCDANAFRRGGARLAGTHGEAVRDSKRDACRVAVKECERKLHIKRKVDRQGYPFAQCQVTNTQRVAVRRKDSGPKIILKF